MIQSINSLISKTYDQSVYTIISAGAAAGSAIILLVSFLSQNKLIKSQIEQHTIYLRSQRESHYEDLGRVLKRIILKNLKVLNPNAIPIDFITSLKIDYNIEDIKNIVLNFAQKHLKNDYPEFEKDLEETNNMVDQLDAKIINFEFQINKTVKERLYNFELVEQLDKPIIIDYLYNYWQDIFKLLENNSNPDEFNLKFRGIQEDYGGHFDGDFYRFSGQGIFKRSSSKSNDEQNFLLSVNNLIKDKEIWKTIEEISTLRNQIKNKIKSCNENLQKIIIQINRKDYNEKCKCCP